MSSSQSTLKYSNLNGDACATAGRVSLSHRFRAIGKEASLVFAGQAAAGLGAIVSVRVLTSLLPPAAFGEYALSLTIVTIAQYCYAGTSAAAMRFFVPAVEKGQGADYLVAAWQVQHHRNLLLALLALLGMACFVAVGCATLVPTAAAAVVIAIVTSYGVFMDGLQNAARQRAVVALHQGASSWLRLGCASGLVVLFGATATNVLLGLAAGSAVVMGSQYFFYRRIKRTICSGALAAGAGDVNLEWRKLMADYAWPYVIWSIPAWLQFSADRWALGWFAVAAEVGVYAALYQLATLPINTLTQLVTQLVMPVLFARAGDLSDPRRVADSRSLNQKLVLSTVAWVLLAVAATAMLQIPIGRLLLDVRYHGSLHLLPLFVLSAGLFSIGQLMELNIVTANQPQRLICPKSTVSLFAFAAYVAGAYSWGIVGVVWAGIVARMIFLGWIVRIDRGLARMEKST